MFWWVIGGGAALFAGYELLFKKKAKPSPVETLKLRTGQRYVVSVEMNAFPTPAIDARLAMEAMLLASGFQPAAPLTALPTTDMRSWTGTVTWLGAMNIPAKGPFVGYRVLDITPV